MFPTIIMLISLMVVIKNMEAFYTWVGIFE